jgi:hypothetical protein
MSALSLPAAALARSGLLKDGTARLVAGGSLLYGLGLAATGFAGDRDGMILAALLTGLGAGLMHAPTLMLVARFAPATLTAICMSAYVGLGSLGNLLGPLASRRLETALLSLTGDSELAFVLLAAIFGSIEASLAIALLLAILFSRYYRRGPTDASPRAQINETAREMPNSPRPPGVLSE